MPKRRFYDPALIEKAVQDVRSGLLTYRTASAKYGIPKSTIEFKLKNPGHRDSCGPPTILTFTEEHALTRWILDLAKRGFPRKKEDILSSVQQFLKENPRPNPFKNNRPGDGWFKAFLRRHPEIAERTSEGVTSASSCVSENDIRKWFSEIDMYIKENDLESVMKDPSRIYNGDETGFQICPKTGKVYAAKGSKNVYSVEQGSSKETVTVMFSFSACGTLCCPMIVYPYKRIPEKISISVNPSWGIGRSDNGWMTAETFYEYIANVFHPHLVEKNIKFPVILFVDGHKSHLNYELSILCNQLQIEIIALYPNATRILQPADVSAFRPIKSAWHMCVREWYINNPGETLNKQTFAPILQKVIDKSIKPETLINGFKICGLFPFNADAVDYSKCLAKGKGTAEVENKCAAAMTYSDFLKIVGSEKNKKFESIDKVAPDEESNEHFWDLYHVWRYFKFSTQELIVNQEIERLNEGSEQVVQEPENKLLSVTNISDIIQTNSEIEQLIETDGQGNSENLIETDDENASQSSVLKDAKSVIDKSDITNSEIKKLKETDGQGSENLNNSKKIKVLSDYLIYPNLPQRKGKKQTERLPFAITSKKYQELIEKKRDLQRQLQEEKEARKRKREEAKEQKASKKQRTSKCLNTCYNCKKIIKSKSYLKCDDCKKNYHKGCVPRNHQMHIPNEEDDLYLCHLCYQQDSDSGENEELFETEFEETENIEEIDRVEEATNLEERETLIEETEIIEETENVIGTEGNEDSGKNEELFETEFEETEKIEGIDRVEEATNLEETEILEETEVIEETENVKETEGTEDSSEDGSDNQLGYCCGTESDEEDIEDLFNLYKTETKKLG